jgi:hypothetical protein
VSPSKISLPPLSPAQSSNTSSRRTLSGRRHCRDPVRARTSPGAIALRLCQQHLRTALDHFTASCRSSPDRRASLLVCCRLPEFPGAQRVHGGRGRIRTSVARKERQIYSLLVLATHPPVLEKLSITPTTSPANCYLQITAQRDATVTENTKRTRVKRHQPVDFVSEDSLRLIPPQANQWSWRRELNPRPSDYKSDALPAELRQRSQTDKE